MRLTRSTFLYLTCVVFFAAVLGTVHHFDLYGPLAAFAAEMLRIYMEMTALQDPCAC